MAGNLLVKLADADLFTGPRITPWAVPDYLTALAELAEAQEMDLPACARKFGTVDLPSREKDGEKRWRHHPVLGFGRKL
jgi:CRISPR-associated endonuclease/helicase Cas3